MILGRGPNKVALDPLFGHPEVPPRHAPLCSSALPASLRIVATAASIRRLAEWAVILGGMKPREGTARSIARSMS